jgi:Ca2+-binding RTX toxin-like protein
MVGIEKLVNVGAVVTTIDASTTAANNTVEITQIGGATTAFTSVGGGASSIAGVTAVGTITAATLTLTGAAALANTLTGSSTNATTITGGNVVDTITGGAGADLIIGGTGADVLTGAAGVDSFRFSAADGSAAIAGVTGTFTGHDTILDFATGDIISLNKASILLNETAAPTGTVTGVASGAFNANAGVGVAFITGATAADLTNIANVITAIGAIGNETATEAAYFIVANTAGTQSGIYAFTSVVAGNTITAGELVLIGVTTGVIAAATDVVTF